VSIERLFTSGLAVDIALAVIALEFVVLLLRKPRASWKSTSIDLLCALGPGACLMLALRAAMTGGGAIPIAFWLALSFPLHLADIRRRDL
jgi:hypothetical protein